MAARGEQVSSLVSAMQNGTISKSELFVSLSELQRSSTSPPKNPSSDANRVQTLVGAMREGKLSKAELMASLSSLRSESRAAHVDEPRAARRGGTPPRYPRDGDASSDAEASPRGYGDLYAPSEGYGAAYRAAPHPKTEDASMSRELREAEMWADLRASTTSPASPPAPAARGAWDDAEPARAETDDAPQQPPPPPSPRAWGSNASHPRARVARLSEDDECTFRPKVKKLPAKLYASANRSAGSFLERTDRWASERDANVARRQRDGASNELSECTFAPEISTNSRRAAAVTRARDARSANARLYEEETARRAARDARREEVAAERETAFAETHPFAPSIETEAPRATSAYARKPVKSRYRAPTKASAKDEPPPGCTFRPAIAKGCDVPNFLARPCSTRFG